MLEQLTGFIKFPEWCGKDSRYRRLLINDMWLDGDFYRQEYGFYDTDAGGRFRKMFDRRPSVQLNIPALTSDLIGRKLFTGRHVPRVLHPEENYQDALKWLFKEAKTDRKFREAAFKGQSGSLAIAVKIVDNKPRLDVLCGKDCWPTFNDAQELERLIHCYVVDGIWWGKQGIYTDSDGEKIEEGANYWYVRVYDDMLLSTAVPIKEEKWNPENPPYEPEQMAMLGTEPWVSAHKLGFVPAVWITNLVAGKEPDGRATFGNVLDNCIDLDYDLSQIGRGIKAMANAQIVVKGKMINYDKHQGGVHILDSSHMIHLEADKQMGDQKISGSEASLLEMSGAGIDKSMAAYVERVKSFTMEIMAANRKDPNTVKGTLSGKAIELIDEDFIELLYDMRSSYGDYGMLLVIIALATLCIRLQIDKFKGLKEEKLKDTELRYPALYEPDAQDTQFLSTALSTAIAGGLIAQPQAAAIFDMHLDKSTDIFDLGQEYGKIPAPTVPLAPNPPGSALPQPEPPKNKNPARKAK